MHQDKHELIQHNTIIQEDKYGSTIQLYHPRAIDAMPVFSSIDCNATVLFNQIGLIA